METAVREMNAGLKNLIGERYGRVIINTSLAEESDIIYSLIDNLNQDVEALDGTAYIIGSSAIAHEMSNSFPDEMYRITILTVIAIFIIVALAFRSVTIPFILVCIIQCAVFITMGVASLQGNAVNYLPLLIVQCLLLGATVDYAILYASYYREARMNMNVKDSVTLALHNSVHTILTSGLILVSITGVMNIFIRYSDPAISQILITISIGGTCAMVLVIFVLPGIIAAFDRLIIRKRK
jgi:predicted RND superfamily exporter protein